MIRYISLLIFSVLVLSIRPTVAQVRPNDKQASFARFLEQKTQADQEALRRFSARYGVPLHQKTSEGTQIGFHRIEQGRPHYRVTLEEVAGQAIEADHVWPGGSALIDATLSGVGQTVGIWEAFGLPRIDHTEFSDGLGGSRITHLGIHHNDTNPAGGHATHVTGLAAAGGSQPFLRGIAYESTIHAYDDSLDLAEMATAAAGGLRVSDHAYGDVNGWGLTLNDGSGSLPAWSGDPAVDPMEDYQFGFYDSQSKAWDAFAFSEPEFNIVIAVGNDREGKGFPAGTEHWVFTGVGPFNGWEKSTDTRDDDCTTDAGYDCVIGGIQSAKNVLSIGTVENFAGTGCAAAPDNPLSMVSYSGWGPTDDGRIKPDFVAPGYKMRSPRPGTTTAWSCGGGGGTSWASPVVTGALALLFEHQENLFPGIRRKAATYKALLVHTVTDLGNAGPDYTFGWGIPNIQKAAELMQKDKDQGGDYHIYEETLMDAGTFTLQVVSDGSPLTTTIAWTDPAGTPVSETEPSKPLWIDRDDLRMLVNDLDLRITGTNAVLPWTLDPMVPASVAVQNQDNDRDNAEQILIQNPVFGETYTITINHKGTLSGGSQMFSLVVDGILATLPADMVSINVKVFLQGPYAGATMSTTLNANSLIPTTQPYGTTIFTGKPLQYAGTESVSAGFFASNPDIVDWVVLELRATPNGPTLASRAAFLKSDGTVVDLDGTSPVKFFGVGAGSYYIVIGHRNHLDIMSAGTVALSVAASKRVLDYNFTTSPAQAFGNDLKDLGGGLVFGMYAGDANPDGILTYTGANRDSREILLRLGLNDLEGSAGGYEQADMNMDGVVEYVGVNQDQQLILLALGLSNVAGQITSQVPAN